MFINREAVHYVKFALSNSPIQVLTRPEPAKLPRSDKIGCIQGGMAVGSTMEF